MKKKRDEAILIKQDIVVANYNERLGKILGKSAIIKVGGGTEAEIKEIKDRVDDAVHATQGAISEGVVVGGGAALIHASKALKRLKEGKSVDEKFGIEIIEKACRETCKIIAENAGFVGII